MPNENNNLNRARQNRQDEFYTQLTDIEHEMQHYRKHFKNKVVYCNCDDPYVSAFMVRVPSLFPTKRERRWR